MGAEALVFIAIFYGIMMIPCVGIGWIGYKLMTRLGNYPSRTPAIQLSIMVKLIGIELVSLTLLLSFFKVLVAE